MSQTVWLNGESQEVVVLVQNVVFIRKAIDNIFERSLFCCEIAATAIFN